MDFGLSEEQLAVQNLAKQIFRGLAPAASLAEVEASGTGFHRAAWEGLAQGELLGIALPQEVGGGGMGLVELSLLVEQAGDAACPIPLLPTLVMAGLPIARFGSPAQRSRLLASVIQGKAILSAALVESAEPVHAEPAGANWLLHGIKDFVPALQLASCVLVPARMPNGGLGAFLVDPKAKGVTIEQQIGTNQDVLGRLTLSGAIVTPDDILGDVGMGEQIIAWALERTHVAQCAFELGVARRALILTAKYANERQQFGRPIGTFQAVAQRLADAYVDVETIRLTAFRAAWLLDQGQDARREIAVAKLIAAEAGHRVVCAAQHVHGGVGFDRDYPLHRYFLASKQNEFTLGSASYHVARLGRLLTEE